MMRPKPRALVVLVAPLLLASCATGQFFLEDTLPGTGDHGQAPAANGALSGGLSQAYPAAPEVSHTYAVREGHPKSVDTLPKDAHGFRILKPGYFYKSARTYCLNPGAHGPGSGDPYVVAPLEGRDAGLIGDLVDAGEDPQVHQDAIQASIWAIEVGNYDYVLGQPEVLAHLGPGDVATLRTRSAEKKGAASAASFVQDNVPSGVQGLLDTGQSFQDRFAEFANGDISFDELAEDAVPTGGSGSAGSQAPGGQWFRMPQGYFIRALPDEYSSTRIEFYVPRPVKWIDDRLGRPRTVIDGPTGLRIDYTYFGETDYVVVPGYPELKAYPFKSVKVTLPASLTHEQEVTIIWRNRGFILVGPLKTFLEQHPLHGAAGPVPLGRGPQVLLADSGSTASDVKAGVESGAAQTGAGNLATLAAQSANEARKRVGELAGLGMDLVNVGEAASSVGTMLSPNVSSVDRARATLNVMSAMPSALSLAGRLVPLGDTDLALPFGIPMSLVTGIVGWDLDMWSKAISATSPGGQGHGRRRGRPTISHTVVFLPRKPGQQGLAGKG